MTSRKQTVRLAATLLPLPDAAALLADAYAQPGQHPDVRAACVASGTGLLGDERMWQVMGDAATGEGALPTAVLRTHPNELDPGHRPRYAKLVQKVCGSDDELVALGHRALVPWLPWAPGAATVLVEALTGMDRRGTWSSAAALATAAPATPQAATALKRALALLATGETADDAGAERDRPRRQRLVRLTEALTAWPEVYDARGRAVLGEAGRVLADHVISYRRRCPCTRGHWSRRARTPTRCTQPWRSWPHCTPAARPSPPGPRAPSDSASRRPEERVPAPWTPCWSSSRAWPGPGTPPRACSPPN
ncbi:MULTISPECIES: hypothetical protein [unclassified Streptomyces]|uniref:hypothetical protein n=1 Tax=unclassified Streptomyces TaxID=2593676 RepID=UPI000B04DB80|nr:MULTISPECIES: hypothetical protein [unclassified Streptomyces]MYR94697.1 hypothetical protein [Streptomyces sp. SID4937]